MPCYRGGYFYDEDDIQQDITFSLSHVRVGDNDVAGFLPSRHGWAEPSGTCGCRRLRVG